MTCLTAEKRGISGLAMKVREGQGVKVKGGVVHPGTGLIEVLLLVVGCFHGSLSF